MGPVSVGTSPSRWLYVTKRQLGIAVPSNDVGHSSVIPGEFKLAKVLVAKIGDNLREATKVGSAIVAIEVKS